MLYIIGMGLNEKGITLEGIESIKKCSVVYLESYTVDFPYNIEKLEETLALKTKIKKLDRKDVESEKILKEAKTEDIALLVYGSPLFATTHLSLLLEAKKKKIKTKIIQAGSIFDSLAETGLELYKFGKITSMPKWLKGKYEPSSFIEIIKENSKIYAHSLILVDIGLEFSDALEQLNESLKNNKIKAEKILVCSNMGTENQRIYYNNIQKLKEKSIQTKIKKPFCFIIPSEKLHFLEKEYIETFED